MGRADCPCCPFHPRQAVVGICAICLRERLLVLAAKQGRLHKTSYNTDNKKVGGSSCASRRVLCKQPPVAVPTVFALSTSLLLCRPECHRKPCRADDDDSFKGFEDSFISIKFEDGRAGASRCNEDIPCSFSYNNGTIVVEQGVKPAGGGALRWRRRVGHLLRRVMGWRRSDQESGIVSEVDVVKGRPWMRNLATRIAA